MAGDNDVAGKWKVAMGQGDNFILTPSHEIPDANRGGILWSRHLPKESQSAPQMEEDFVMEHPENFKILFCRSGTWQRNIKNAICCSSKGKTCGFWRLLLCPWRIEQISLVWKWQNLTFWTVSSVQMTYRENQGTISCTRERTISSAWPLCFFNTTGFVSVHVLLVITISDLWSAFCWACDDVWWLLVGEAAVALTLSWASQPSIIRFVLFSFFNNWIWKSNGNKPVVGSDLKWLRLSLMLGWAHSSPWSAAELCFRPSAPLRKDQGFPVVFQILAAIYVGTST